MWTWRLTFFLHRDELKFWNFWKLKFIYKSNCQKIRVSTSRRFNLVFPTFGTYPRIAIVNHLVLSPACTDNLKKDVHFRATSLEEILMATDFSSHKDPPSTWPLAPDHLAHGLNREWGAMELNGTEPLISLPSDPWNYPFSVERLPTPRKDSTRSRIVLNSRHQVLYTRWVLYHVTVQVN